MEDTRERLLDRAREHYLEAGVHHFSLREVARRAGVSAAAVYRHFDDKEALLGALVGEGFKTFYGYLMRALGEVSPLARLRAAGRAYLAFALENSEHYRVIFMSSKVVESVAPETMGSFQFLVDRVRECQDAGDLRPGDATAMAATIWAHVHGLVSLRISGHFAWAPDFESFFVGSTDDVLRGLSP